MLVAANAVLGAVATTIARAQSARGRFTAIAGNDVRLQGGTPMAAATDRDPGWPFDASIA